MTSALMCCLLLFTTKKTQDVETTAHSPGFKPKEALQGEQTMPERESRFGVHPTMINQWKRALPDGASAMVECGRRKTPENPENDDDQISDKVPAPVLRQAREGHATGHFASQAEVERFPDHPT